MRYRIFHKTEYNYSESASLSQNELFLEPRATPFQSVLECNVRIDPEPQYLHHRIDTFGNQIIVFMVQHTHDSLSMEATSVVETQPPITPPPAQTQPWEEVALQLKNHPNSQVLDAYQFVFPSPIITLPPEALEFVQPSFTPGRPILEAALDLTHRIFTEFAYDKNATGVDTTIEEAFAKRKGVCQDFAHCAISSLRSIGLAARYVSGYLETLPPPGKEKLVGADASHAWLSIFIPEFGWVDLDPTNDCIPQERHITLAWGRDYGDVTPVKGVVMGGGQHELSVAVDISVFKQNLLPK